MRLPETELDEWFIAGTLVFFDGAGRRVCRGDLRGRFERSEYGSETLEVEMLRLTEERQPFAPASQSVFLDAFRLDLGSQPKARTQLQFRALPLEAQSFGPSLESDGLARQWKANTADWPQENFEIELRILDLETDASPSVLSGSARFRGSDFARRMDIEDQELAVQGELWHFADADLGRDLSGTHSGRYALRLRTIRLGRRGRDANGKRQPPIAGDNRKAQRDVAKQVWSRHGIQVEVLRSIHVFNTDGCPFEASDVTRILNQLSSDGDVLSVFFVSSAALAGQRIQKAGGATFPTGVSFEILMDDSRTIRPLVLAHEIGHALGGLHPGSEGDPAAGTWVGEAGSILDPAVLDACASKNACKKWVPKSVDETARQARRRATVVIEPIPVNGGRGRPTNRRSKTARP